MGSNSPGLPPTLPAPSPGALSSSASATFHASSGTTSATNAIKSSTSAASFTTHAVIETRSFGPQTLPMRSQVRLQNKLGTFDIVTVMFFSRFLLYMLRWHKTKLSPLRVLWQQSELWVTYHCIAPMIQGFQMSLRHNLMLTTATKRHSGFVYQSGIYYICCFCVCRSLCFYLFMLFVDLLDLLFKFLFVVKTS